LPVSGGREPWVRWLNPFAGKQFPDRPLNDGPGGPITWNVSNHPSSRRIRITSGPGALRRLVRALRESLVLEIRSPEARALALLAVEEAAVNILEHGYDRAPGRPLQVTFRSLEPDRFQIELRDRAPTVDVSRMIPGDLKQLAARQSIRGRGVAMVRMFTESVRHAPRRGGGNILTLVFDAGRLSRLAEEHSREAA